MTKKKELDLEELCLQLVYAESENEVIRFLEGAGYWKNNTVWKYYGDSENNYSQIGNQQSDPDTALVEKIVNSVDAMLTRECLKRSIDPESEQAPRTTKEALIDFFKINDGNLANINVITRRELASNIMLVASGRKTKPCISIIDKGEGQIPTNFHSTFLSLMESNKLRIPFVQGRFNMGSTGVLAFCGEHQLQLILSKRCPDITNKDEEGADEWGFTIVRRFDPIGNMKNSVYKYLAPKGEVLTFKSESLPILPDEYPLAFGKPLRWGTFVKLYEYKLSTKLSQTILHNLYYRLSLLLPSIALPVTLYERRKIGKEKGHTYHTYLNGLSVRLEEDKRSNIEEGFPTSVSMSIGGQKVGVRIFVFKKIKGRSAKISYAEKDAIIFTVNGQAHGFISKNFLERTKVNMTYLSDSILIIVDCSNIEQRTKEELFMNSRDRLRSGKFKRDIEKKLEQIIKNHAGLKSLSERRRREELQGKIKEKRPLRDVIEKLISMSPSFANLFVEGRTSTNPFNLHKAGRSEIFKGEKYPKYFKLTKNFTDKKPKNAQINRDFRIRYETDAVNDYFTRDDYPGEFEIDCKDEYFVEKIKDYDLNLWEGKAILTVSLPPAAKVGDIINFTSTVSDVKHPLPFAEQIFVKVIKEIKSGKGKSRKPPSEDKPGNKDSSNREKPLKLNLPETREVYEPEWEEYNFDGASALRVKGNGKQGYDFYINMDNRYLHAEIKGNPKVEVEVFQEQYKTGMVIVGLSLLQSLPQENEDYSIYDDIEKITKALSPVFLPLVTTLKDITL
ncbi:hypothetical protein ES705_09914 [subsurface metagenome]